MKTSFSRLPKYQKCTSQELNTATNYFCVFNADFEFIFLTVF